MKVEKDWVKIRRDLHQIPEVGYKEVKTQAYLLKFIRELPQEYVTIQTWETGIFVFVQGKKGERTIAYRTDIDGLPIREETGYAFASTHEGFMHACGHDLHMTIALGALSHIVQDRVDDHVLFIFQPAEEGPGGALPMSQSDFFNQHRPNLIFALHIDPARPVGTVASRGGLLFANTSELMIDFEGKGGHAAYPHQTKDMVLAASTFNLNVQQLVSRVVDPLHSAVVTIGKMEAGTVMNIIAEHARLEGTMRTTHPDTMDQLKSGIQEILSGIETRYHCQTSIDFGAGYYMVDNTQEWVDKFKRTIENKTAYTYEEAEPAMAGEDFGYFLKEVPGFMFWLGVSADFGLHHNRLNPNEEAIQVGIDSVVATLNNI